MFKCAALIALFFSLFYPMWVNGQYSNRQIDSFLNIVTQAYRFEGRWAEALLLYKKTLQASKQNNYQKGLVESYMNVGSMHYILGNSTASIKYLDTALAEISKIENVVLEVRILSELGKNYFHLNQHKKALQYFDKSLAIIDGIRDDQTRFKNLQYIYNLQASIYEKDKDIPNYYTALEKAYKVWPIPLLASKMAKYFLEYNKNLDSARTYIEKANKMWETGSYPVHQRSVMLRSEGLYYFHIKEYDKAIKFYKESIAISQSLGNKEEEQSTYKLLAIVHEKLKSVTGRDSALKKSEQIGDTLNKDIEVATGLPDIATPQEKGIFQRLEKKSGTSKIWWYIAVLFLIVLFAAAFFYHRLRKRNHVK